MQGTPLTVCHDCKEMVLQVGKLLPGVAGGGGARPPLRRCRTPISLPSPSEKRCTIAKHYKRDQFIYGCTVVFFFTGPGKWFTV